MGTINMSLKELIHASSPAELAPNISRSTLNKRLASLYPGHDVDDLLDRTGLMTRTGAIDPMLIQQSLVKVTERFPNSNALVLEEVITEHGARVIQAIVQDFLENYEHQN